MIDKFTVYAIFYHSDSRASMWYCKEWGFGSDGIVLVKDLNKDRRTW